MVEAATFLYQHRESYFGFNIIHRSHCNSSPPKQTLALSFFSYACVAGIPQPQCAIRIWGWKSSGRMITRVISYPRLDPGHIIEDFKMNRTTFSRDWQDLKSVGFSIARADNGGDMYGGLALDDVEYTIMKGC